MGRAALHLHSTHSDGRCSVSEILDLLDANGTIDVVSFTDHDEVGAYADAVSWKQQHPNSALDVLWGCEITVRGGKHVLAYIFQPPYPSERFPSFEPFQVTIDKLTEAGGVCIIAHPDQWVVGMGLKKVERYLATVPILGVESHSPYVRSAPRLSDFALKHNLAQIAGSDAHFREHLVKWVTEYPGTGKDDLYAALRQAQTKPVKGAKAAAVPVSELLLQQVQALVIHPSKKVRRALLPSRNPA